MMTWSVSRFFTVTSFFSGSMRSTSWCIQAVYLRTGVGLEYVDPYFQSNYEKALDTGLNIGHYHYVTAADTFQARQQAEFFYSLIQDKQRCV